MNYKEIGAPKLTREHIRLINSVFRRYLIYRKKNGVNDYICTACGAHFTGEMRRTISQNDCDLMSGKHNTEAYCPECRSRAVIKNASKLTSCASLYQEERIALLIGLSQDEAWIIAGFAHKSYSQDDLEPEPVFDPKYVCRMIPGKTECWYKSCSGLYFKPEKWTPCRIKEPFNFYMGSGGDYWFIRDKASDNCFLKYSAYEQYSEQHHNTWLNTPVSYYGWYAMYPQIEMLVKFGFEEFVRPLISRKQENRRLLNWTAGKPWEFFKMTKPEFLEFCDAAPPGKRMELLKIYRHIEPKHRNFIISGEIQKNLDYHSIEFVLLCKTAHADPAKALKYVFSQTQEYWHDRFITWRDYIDAAKKLKYDLRNETVLYPKNLKERHDTAVSAVRYEANREKNERYAKRILPGLEKKYAFTGDRYAILVPKCMEEIIREGKLQQHCVGGYAERHMTGAVVILFLRDLREPEKPLFTIQMNGKFLVQVQGLKNESKPRGKSKEFFDQWLAWVSAGSPRNSETGEPDIPENEPKQIA